MPRRIPPDITPLTVTMPAYVWRLVKDAVAWDLEHAARRAANRTKALTGEDLNLFRMTAMRTALAAINEVLPSGEAAEVYANGKHVGFVESEPGDQWRARALSGSSLGVYPTRAAAERAVLSQ